MADDKSEAVTAGRGVLYIAGAKLYFMIAGLVMETQLPRLLGPFLYGAYGFIAQGVSILNNVVVTGTIQAVSRYTTADPERADDVKAAGLRMHLFVGVPLALVFAAGSPLWAALAHDSGKTPLLMLAAVIVALYSFYTVFIGSANGTHAFHKQAGLDVTFSTLRTGGLIAAAALGLGVWGAISAWVAAAAAILVTAAVVVGVPRRLRAGDPKPIARFLGGMVIYLGLFNLILAVDQIILKRLATEWFVAHGVADASTQADGQVGFYRAAQNLGRLPYQLMIAVTFVIFPLVSRATFANDPEKTRSYVRSTMRYSLIFAGFVGVALASSPTQVLALVYPREYAVGAAALTLLALGNVAFAIFAIAGTILNGAGLVRDAILVSAGTLILLVVALFVAVPHASPGHDLLMVCAAATGGAMLLGAAISGAVIFAHFKSFLPVLTVARVTAATAAALLVGQRLPARGKIVTLVEVVAAAAVYLAVLVAGRELGRADVAAFARVLVRRRT
jgi:stage V sporulation protein B